MRRFALVGLVAALAGVLAVPLCTGQQETKKMTNREVTEMESLGLSDEVIVDKIHAAEATDFDTGINALRALKAAHVSDTVIRAMINPRLAAGNSNAGSVQGPPTNTTSSADLVQQAADLDRQADDAGAKAAQLEQKNQGSGRGLVSIIGAPSSIRAKQLRDKERQLRQQAQNLRAQAAAQKPLQDPHTPVAGSSGASSESAQGGTGSQPFDNGWCTLKYPTEWKAYPGLYAVVLSPQPQLIDHSGTNTTPPEYGAYFKAVHTAADIGYRGNKLTRDDFQRVVAVLKLEDVQAGRMSAWGTQLTDAVPMVIGGRPAQAAEFTKFNTDRAWVVMILPPGTGLGHGDFYTFYVEFLAPADQFEARRPIFQKIANSIVVKDIGLPKCGPGVRPGPYCHE